MKLTWVRRCFFIFLLMMIVSGLSVSHAQDVQKNRTEKQNIPVEIASEKRPIKTIGIIGGVSWASSIEYYRIMNELVRDRLGGVSSAQLIMYSVAHQTGGCLHSGIRHDGNTFGGRCRIFTEQ